MSIPNLTSFNQGLPAGYYDRFTGSGGSKNWKAVLFNPGQSVQSPELNEIQEILLYQFGKVGNNLYSDGTYLTGGTISSAYQSGPGNYLVSVTSGSMWAYGFVHDIGSLSVTITGSGTETVQMVIGQVATSGVPSKPNTTYDSALLDPVTGAEDYGYAGADRLNFSYSLVANSPSAGPTIATFDNGQLVPTPGNGQLSQFLALLAEYFYETLGSYVAVEPSLAFVDTGSLVSDPINAAIEIEITGGVGYVEGYRFSNASNTVDLPIVRPMTGGIQNGEPHIYNTGTLIYSTFKNPINSFSNILALRQSPTLTITKGASHGTDNVPSQYWPVAQIISVSQGATTYVQGTDYQQNGDGVQWLSGGSQPSTSTTYSVVVQYEYTMVKAVRTLTSVSSESHTYTGASTILTNNSDLESLVSVIDHTTSHTFVAGTDYTVALNTGTITWINPPTSGDTIYLNYAYWAHTTEGDYVSRDSFVDSSGNVMYNITPVFTPGGHAVNYLNQVSFDTTSGNLPINGSEMFFTYYVTLGRTDYLAWHYDGTFRIIQGTPSLNPVPPTVTAQDMPVAYIYLPPEATAETLTWAYFGNLAVSEVQLNTMLNDINEINAEISAIDTNIATLFAGIPYFVIDINHSQSPYNITNLYAVYVVDATSGNIVINLPQMVSGFRANLVFIRKDSTTNTVTITPYSGQTIFGNSNYSLNIPQQGVTVFPDVASTNWVSASRNSSFNMVQFTSSGTYTPSAGTKQILVLVQGAGGGGAGSDGVTDQGEPGGGGGAGSLAVAWLPTTALTLPATITIGTGGAGGSGSGESANTSGSNGSNSQFTTTEIGSALTGYGGEGGINAYTVSGNITPQGGRGGGALQSASRTGTITDSLGNTHICFNIFGSPGAASASGGAGVVGNGAAGGASPMSGGGIGGWMYQSGTLQGPYSAQAGGFGAGGGSAGFSNAGAKAGAAGGSGVITIIEFKGN